MPDASSATGVRVSESPARPAPSTRTPPAFLPLVSARAIGSNTAASIAATGGRPAEVAPPVVARLANPAGTRAGAGAPGMIATRPERAGVGWAATAAVQREALPGLARAIPGSGRGASSAGFASSAGLSSPPLAYAAGEPTAAETYGLGPGRSGGGLSWSADTGFTSTAGTPGPFVQRAVEIDEVTVTADASAAGAAEAGAGAAGQAGPAGAPAAGAGPDLEELAEHLYDRIRSRLTSELLLDRERSGTLVDA